MNTKSMRASPPTAYSPRTYRFIQVQCDFHVMTSCESRLSIGSLFEPGVTNGSVTNHYTLQGSADVNEREAIFSDFINQTLQRVINGRRRERIGWWDGERTVTGIDQIRRTHICWSFTCLLSASFVCPLTFGIPFPFSRFYTLLYVRLSSLSGR